MFFSFGQSHRRNHPCVFNENITFRKSINVVLVPEIYQLVQVREPGYSQLTIINILGKHLDSILEPCHVLSTSVIKVKKI